MHRKPHVRFLLPAEVFVNKQPSLWEGAATLRTRVDLDACGLVRGRVEAGPEAQSGALAELSVLCPSAPAVGLQRAAGEPQGLGRTEHRRAWFPCPRWAGVLD